MATIKTTLPQQWAQTESSTTDNVSIWSKLTAFADSQKPNRTLWFFVNLVVHGVSILPLPVVLIYYFGAPVAILGITMIVFFVNIVANMGGSGIRTTLGLFAASIAIHVLMVLATLIF
ncbi:hypothetical protein ACFQZS_09105 [Mucilaginibacter calamicampi]|uniref:Uncharacterized protein n=1 Tax=Mucilaginibacter calamicampi TaxID=1302352 RepID=A0ABW2YY11_9SPHI